MSKNRDLIYDMSDSPETEDFEQLDSEPLQLGGVGEDGRPQVVFGRQGKRDYKNAFLRQEREDGRIFYTVAGEIFDTDKSEPTDIYAVEQGYIAVTPLMVDLTDYIAIEKLLDR